MLVQSVLSWLLGYMLTLPTYFSHCRYGWRVKNVFALHTNLKSQSWLEFLRNSKSNVFVTRSQNNSKWNDQPAEHCFVYKIFLNELWMIYSQKIPVVLVLTQSFWRKKGTTSASPIMLPNKIIYNGQKLLPRVVLNVDVKSGQVCSHTWSQPRPRWPWHYSP